MKSSGTTMDTTETILHSLLLQKVLSRNFLGLKWNARDGGDRKEHGTISLLMVNGKNTHPGSSSHIPKVKARMCYWSIKSQRMNGLRKKSKTEWDDSDEPGEEDPSTYEYVLTGNADTLDGVKQLIDTLCQSFGIPENVEDGLGMFVPQRLLMKVLVGADTEYYRGNIMEMDGPSPLGGGKEGARLVITTEADKGEPLLYALRQCFENLEIEMKETEW